MNFVVVDVETANPRMASICQIGVVGFEDGLEAFADSVLVDPGDYFDPLHVSIHGITEADVAGAPSFSGVRPWLEDRLKGHVVVCHTAFDRTALQRACSAQHLESISCRWLDSARIARRAWPEYSERGYGLANLAKAFGISFAHHDALEDARAAGLILLKAIAHSGIDLDGWFTRCDQPLTGQVRSVARTGDGDGPLLGEVVVVTGTLSLPRQDVADLIDEAGGAVDSGVTKRTTLLVVGDQDISKLAGKTKSAKHLKAEQLIADGYPIRVIQESDLAALIGRTE